MMVRAAQRLKDDFLAIADGVGMAGRAARAIVALEEPMTMSVLAERLDIDAALITALADDLEADGLARRFMHTDRRYRWLELTEKGLAVREQLREKLVRESTINRHLDAEEKKQLRAIVAKLLE